MSQAIAVSTIQERVRVMCGLPVFTTNTTITSAAMLDFIKVAVSLLAGIVKEASSELYFAEATTVETVADLPMVSFPSNNFSDLIRLAWQKDENTEVPIERATLEEMSAGASSSGWADVNTGRPKYRLLGQTIELYPTPDAVYTLNVHYSTGLYPTSTTSTMVCRDGWDQWMALQTCVLVRAAQTRDASDFNTLLYGADWQSGLTAAIKRQLPRDRAGIHQARDVRGMESPLNRPRWPF